MFSYTRSSLNSYELSMDYGRLVVSTAILVGVAKWWALKSRKSGCRLPADVRLLNGIWLLKVPPLSWSYRDGFFV